MRNIDRSKKWRWASLAFLLFLVALASPVNLTVWGSGITQGCAGFGGVFFCASQYANVSAAVTAAGAASGGIVYLSGGTTYSLPTGGLTNPANVEIKGLPWSNGGTPPKISCAGVGAGTAQSACITNNGMLRDVVVISGGTTNATQIYNNGLGSLDNVRLETGTARSNGVVWFALSNTAITRNVRVDNGAGSQISCLFTSSGGTTTFHISVYDLNCGTPGNAGSNRTLKIENSARIDFFGAKTDEPGSATTIGVEIVNSSGINFYGGDVFSRSDAATTVALSIDASSSDNGFFGTTIEPWFCNGACTVTDVVTVLGDRNRFLGVRMNAVGTITNSFNFAAGADNNFVSGYVSYAIADAGANNTKHIFDGTETVFSTTPYTTAALGGGALLAGACASTTVAVNAVAATDTIDVTPQTYPGDGNYWLGYMSAANTVTVKVCAAVAGTPVSSVYNVRVTK